MDTPTYQRIPTVDRKAFCFQNTLSKIGTNDGLKLLVPSTQYLVGAAMHILVATAVALTMDYTASPHVWHLLQSIAACSLIVLATAYAAIPEKHVWWISIAWIIVLTLCLSLDATWHWRHATNRQFMVGLTVVHWGAMLLFAHYYVAILLFVLFLLGTLCNFFLLENPPIPTQQGWAILIVTTICVVFMLYHKRKEETCSKQNADVQRVSMQEAQAETMGPLNDNHDIDLSSMDFADMANIEKILQQNLKKNQGQNENRYIDLITKELADMEKILQQNLGKGKGPYEESMHENQATTTFALSRLWKKKYWSAYLNDRSTVAPYTLIRPSRFALHDLFAQVATIANLREKRMPSMLFRSSSIQTPSAPNKQMHPATLPYYMVGDRDALVALIWTAVECVLRRVIPVGVVRREVVVIDCCFVRIQYKTLLAKTSTEPKPMTCPAIAMLIRNMDSDATHVPPTKPLYTDTEDINHEEEESLKTQNAAKSKIKTIVRGHYGHVQFQFGASAHPSQRRNNKNTCRHNQDVGPIHIVLPVDVQKIQQEIAQHLPKTAPIAPLHCQQSDALRMKCAYLSNNGLFIYTSELEAALQLLRNNYGNKMHDSGVSMYSRSVTIAQAIADELYNNSDLFEPREWGMLYNPNPLVYTGLICAALLYDLPNHTSVSRIFLRAHYDQATYAFIQAISSIQGIQLPNTAQSFRVAKGAKKSYVRKELAALYIKLIEYLHDLNHAKGYANKAIAIEMAQVTLLGGISLAQEYFPSTNLSDALQAAARAALTKVMHTG